MAAEAFIDWWNTHSDEMFEWKRDAIAEAAWDAATDVAEEKFSSTNSESTQCLSYEQCTGRLTDGCFNGIKSCYRK